MICYLDTSALIKLYIDEDGTRTVQAFAKKSKVLATSIVAYAEARAAVKRGLAEEIIYEAEYRLCMSNFKKDWKNYLIVNIDKSLIFLAGDLAEKYNLRGFDSIHLASAVVLREKLNIDILFLCWDKKLEEAAIMEGFKTNRENNDGT